MTLLVPVAADTSPAPSVSPLGVEVGAVYEIISAVGVRAVLNDATDKDFVGYLTDVSGLDSAEVRDAVDYKVAAHGARHGTFYYGRRTLSLSGIIGSVDAEQRNSQLSRLQRATDAMREDSVIRWQTTGGVPVELSVRRADPLRVGGMAQKSFQIGLAAADPKVYARNVTAWAGGSTAYSATAWSSSTTYPAGVYVTYGGTTYLSLAGSNTNRNPGTETAWWEVAVQKQRTSLRRSDRVGGSWAANLLVETLGTDETPPIITLTGPLNIVGSGEGWRVYNATTDTYLESIATSAANLSAGSTLTLDYAARTVTHSSGASWYDKISFVQSDWTGLAAGTNDLRFYGTGTSSSTGFRVEWRDAWL